MAEKGENIDMYGFSAPDCTQEQNFLLLFDNANDRLCQERLLGKSEEELP